MASAMCGFLIALNQIVAVQRSQARFGLVVMTRSYCIIAYGSVGNGEIGMNPVNGTAY
jgi:hypothetical protein